MLLGLVGFEGVGGGKLGVAGGGRLGNMGKEGEMEPRRDLSG